MQKLDQDREEEHKEKVLKVEEERRRQQEALERAKKEKLTSMLNESLIAKQDKLRALEMAE